MDPIDPLKGMPFSGMPVPEEITLQVKKQVRQARMETSDPAQQSSDVSDLSLEGMKLARPGFEAFLEAAKDEILQMDRDSDTYLPDATQKLVSNALERKFGERFRSDPGYQQMEARMTSFILNDPDSRTMMENFLELIHLEGGQG